jgi:hypothetical protein
MATPDGGLAAISYAPCTVTGLAGKKVPVEILVETNYPFEEKVLITINPGKESRFPLVLRIPSWVNGPSIKVNGETISCTPGEFATLNRKWKKGDQIELVLTSAVRLEERYRSAVAVAKGPLYFSIRIPKDYTAIETCKKHYSYMGSADWQIEPAGSWNYGLVISEPDPAKNFEVIINPVGRYPFGDSGDPVYNATAGSFDTLRQDPPIMLRAKGMLIPEWDLVDHNAGPTPYSPVTPAPDTGIRSIELIPYASARLRLSEIPVIKK